MQIEKVKVNSDLIVKMLKEQKWRQCDICEPILGIKCGTFSSSLGRGRMRIDVVDKLAALLKVNREYLLADDFLDEKPTEIPEPEITTNKAIDKSEKLTKTKALYNFLTSFEAALTNFRQDLLALEQEDTDGKI